MRITPALFLLILPCLSSVDDTCSSSSQILPLTPSTPPPTTTTSFHSILQYHLSPNSNLLPTRDVGLELTTAKNTYILQARVLEWEPDEPLLLDQGPKERTILQEVYELKSLFAGGSCGEVWLAYGADRRRFVLKRVFSERGERFIRAGMREIYFGTLLRGEVRVSRFIEAFNRTSSATRFEMWLVFEDEGRSLKSYLYRTSSKGVVTPSDFWHRLRKQQNGPALRRELVRQIALGLDALSRRGIVHRDVKPGNIFITPPRFLDEAPVKIGDFGSALDQGTLLGQMFGPEGPSRLEHTKEYEPPEAAESLTSSFFDAWSLGIVCLEVLLGTDSFFSSPPRLHRKRPVGDVFADFSLDNRAEFNRTVVAADRELRRGFYDDQDLGPLELDFVFRLLQPLPSRMSLSQALDHPYLSGVGQSTLQFACSCGRLFSAHSACKAHADARGHEGCMVKDPRLSEQCSPFGLIERPDSRSVGLCGDKGGRLHMEDAGGARDGSIVVADGHSGHKMAHFAVAFMLEHVASCLEAAAYWSTCATRLFQKTHEEFKRLFEGDESGAAVTLVSRLGSSRLLVANVGDVRAILCCELDGQPLVLTVDHVASNASEQALVLGRGGFITPKKNMQGKERVNGQLVLTRCLGDVHLEHVISREPSIMTVDLQENWHKFLVVASDGVWDSLSVQEVVTISKSQNLEEDQSDALEEVGALPWGGTLPWAQRVAAKIVLESKARAVGVDNVFVGVWRL